MATNIIGIRLKALREERKLSQEDLARIFGCKDRQTVSAIETGERRVSADELLLAIQKLGASLDYFTDSFLLAGEGKFWSPSPARGIAKRQSLRARGGPLDCGEPHAVRPGRQARADPETLPQADGEEQL
jgi:transcriptional regulator with XRE-family HTH domain